jgi:hypothetical protein
MAEEDPEMMVDTSISLFLAVLFTAAFGKGIS